MDQRLHFLTLATPDLDAALSFYRDGLGWTVFHHEPGEIIFFQTAQEGAFGGVFHGHAADPNGVIWEIRITLDGASATRAQ